MNKILSFLVYAWKTPSAFWENKDKYLANQLGHGSVGVIVGWVWYVYGGFWLPIIFLSFYLLWEMTQYFFRQAEVSDCIEDWAFMAGGVFFGLTGDPVLFALLILNLATGYSRRWELEKPES